MLRRLAPHSLEAHARLVHRDDANRPIVAARHHAEWIRILEDREKYPWVCVVAPPGYAKSTWFSWIYPTWRLGVTKGRARIGVVSNAAGQATGWTQAIGESVDSDLFAAAYGGVEPDKKRGWSRGHFFLNNTPDGNNPAVLASGLGGVSVLGKRFDEIVLDDPTTWENARSDSIMDGQRHFLRTTLISRFPPGMGPPDGKGGRMVVVLTRWSERDLVPELEHLGFKIVRMPALGYWDGKDLGEGIFEPGEEPLWPERESREQLESQREEDELVFELVMQGNAAILKGDFFSSDWFSHVGPKNWPARGDLDRVVQYVDTAGGKDRQKGDYFVMLTLGRKGRDFFVLDVRRDRISPLRQEDIVKEMAFEWSPNLVVIEEKNEGGALLDRLKKTTQIKVKGDSPTKDKEFRAMPVAGVYRGGKIHHPQCKDGTVRKWVRNLEIEMEAFPESEHDDQVDALAGAYNSMTKGRPRVRVLG